MLYLTYISFFYFFCNDLKHLCNRIFSGAYNIILLTVIQRLQKSRSQQQTFYCRFIHTACRAGCHVLLWHAPTTRWSIVHWKMLRLRWGLPAQAGFFRQYLQAIPVCPTVLFLYATSIFIRRIPSFRIFFAAFQSRSCSALHFGQIHFLTDTSFRVF